MQITAEQIAALEAEHKRIAVVPSATKTKVKGADGTEREEPDFVCVFRKPKRGEYKLFKRRSFDESQRADAQEAFARVLVVYPTLDEFDLLLEEWPGIPEAASKAFERLAGFEADLSAK